MNPSSRRFSPLAGLELVCLAAILLLAACSQAVVPTPTGRPSPTRPAPTSTNLPATSTLTPSPSFTATPSPTPTATSIPSATPTPIPTYVVLRGEVTIEQAVCHYGPGKPYLYKYGVYQGSNLEILRRVALSDYVEVRAIGGTNPCWVRVDYLKIQGNWLDLQPVPADQVVLPISPYYGALSGVTAARAGDEVTLTWNGLDLRAGDDSLQAPYVVEAWVCQDGQQVFTPLGAYQTRLTITDQPGCAEPSHARLLAAEKHGYTPPVEVPWPPAPTPAP